MFKSKYFRFDNKDSKNYNLAIVSIGSSDNFQFGVGQSVQDTEGLGDVPIFTGIKRDCPTIPITICKMDRENNLLPFRDKELDDICRWLFKKEYKPFISYDDSKVYYGIFTKADKFENGINEGYINLEFQLSSPYAYSTVINDYWIVNKQREIDIFNDSNVESMYYPDVEVELLKDCTDIEIHNMNTGDKVVFENLLHDEHLYIYGDGLRDIVSLVDENRNLFPNFNKKFLKLRYGRNKIVVKGDCKINIKKQYPIAII